MYTARVSGCGIARLVDVVKVPLLFGLDVVWVELPEASVTSTSYRPRVDDDWQTDVHRYAVGGVDHDTRSLEVLVMVLRDLP